MNLNIVKAKAHPRSHAERRSKDRLYVWPEDETVFENLFAGRHNRPVTEYRKALPEIFEKLGIPADTKASWSQYAGCSCPCSPGFVLDRYTHTDYHVTVGRTPVDEEIRKALADELQGHKEAT